jgi:uncharacterized protein YigE (DUF2233 family)
MKIKFILSLILAPWLVSGMSVTQVVDRIVGFAAVVVTVPAAENQGFALLDVPSKREGDNIRSYWNATNHIVMINGGYFNPDFRPTGLFRVDGRTINAEQSKKLSGFIGIDKSGKLHILSRQDKLELYPSLMQSGPFVIDPGGQMGIRSRSGAPARRTLVGLTKTDDLVIIVTEPIYLLDLAEFIAKRFPSIERLLNLDGGPSTALMTGSHTVVNEWPVRNYVTKKREAIAKP